jgi:molecular chaperone GrpE
MTEHDRFGEPNVVSSDAEAREPGRRESPEAGRAAPAAEAPHDAPAKPNRRTGDKAKIEQLEQEVEEARRQAESHLDDLRRLKAEFENYRKRVIKEQTQLLEVASQRVVEKLLPVLDNFELALLAADRSKDYEKLVRGVEIVFGELLEVLHKEGLRKIEAEGKPFDPEQHEAVMQAEGGEGEPVVVDVLRAGYALKDRVLRPAMVKVGRR